MAPRAVPRNAQQEEEIRLAIKERRRLAQIQRRESQRRRTLEEGRQPQDQLEEETGHSQGADCAHDAPTTDKNDYDSDSDDNDDEDEDGFFPTALDDNSPHFFDQTPPREPTSEPEQPHEPQEEVGEEDRKAPSSQAAEGHTQENEEEDDTEASSQTKQLIQESFCVNGCNCNFANGTCVDKRKPGSEPANGQPLDVLAQLCRDDLGMPDVLRQPHYETRRDAGHNYGWKGILAGIIDEEQDGSPLAVSLAQSDISTADSHDILRTWDADAFILPLRSLAAHRGGFEVCYYPRFSKTISHTWHTRVSHGRYDPRQCKHLRLGVGSRTSRWDTYIFFPNLPLGQVDKSRCYLTDEEQKLWVDKILLPAVTYTYRQQPDVLAHHPFSFDNARLKSRVNQYERATSGDHHFTEIFYHLPSCSQEGRNSLDILWQEICRFIEDEEKDDEDKGSLQPFQGAFLACITFGCKLRWRDESLKGLQSMVRYSVTTQFFNRSFVDFNEAWVDLGIEDTPVTLVHEKEPLVLLRRSGCNFADAASLGLVSRMRTFNWCGLGQASDFTAEPGWTHGLRAGGVAYVQGYNLTKELFAGPSRDWRPFNSPDLRAAGLSQQALSDLLEQNHTGSSWRISRDSILKAIKATMERISESLDSAAKASRGVRKEYRLSWRLFFQLDEPERLSPEDSTTDNRDENCPGQFSSDIQHRVTGGDNTQRRSNNSHLPYWTIPTAVITEFMRWQFNRWLYPLEVLAKGAASLTRQSVKADRLQQAADSAMISALLDSVELCVNNAYVVLRSRLAYSEYERRTQENRQTSRLRDRRLDTSGEAVETIEALILESDGENDGNDVEEAHQAEPDRRKRYGLGFAEAMSTYGVVHFHEDHFNWSDLAFKSHVLPHTGFVFNAFREKLRNWRRLAQNDKVEELLDELEEGITEEAPNAIEDACRAMYELISQSYSNYVLLQLHKHKQLPNLSACGPRAVSGFYGLTYGLVRQAIGDLNPILSYPHGSNRNQMKDAGSDGSRKKLSDFPNTWQTRLQLLFDWDDGFVRTWDNQRFRTLARRCYNRLEAAAGSEAAERWRKGIGKEVQAYINIVPVFEDSRLWRTQQANPNLGATLLERRRAGEKEMVWIAARNVGGDTFKTRKWEMIRSKKEETQYLRDRRLKLRAIFCPRKMRKIAEKVTGGLTDGDEE